MTPIGTPSSLTPDCHFIPPTREHLYFATGFGLIQCFKGLMSFEDEVRIRASPSPLADRLASQDLLAALNHVKNGNTVASEHRKRAASLPTRLAGLVLGSLNTSGVGWIKSMTPVERHAELVYAESLFEKVRRPLFPRARSPHPAPRPSSALSTPGTGSRSSRKREQQHCRPPPSANP